MSATNPMSTEVQISVIIPMYDEEKFIGQCLESLAASTVPQNRLEVLVVDGGSSDRSRAIIQERAGRFSSLRLLENPKRLPGAAMNVGIAEARGEYVVRMDSHSEYPPEYIQTCIEELLRTGAANVGGCCVTRPGAETSLAHAFALFAQHPFGVGNSRFRLGRGGANVDTVPFGTFRRELFTRLGGFREDLVRHEDYEFNSRIRAAGGKVYLSDRIQSWYHNVPTFGRFLRQAWRGGYWNARCWLTSRHSFAWRHSPPLLFVAALLFCAAWDAVERQGIYAFAAILALYGITALVASASIAWRHGWKFVVVMPLLFFSYHFVYGVATTAGALGTPFARGTCPPPAAAKREAELDANAQSRVTRV